MEKVDLFESRKSYWETVTSLVSQDLLDSVPGPARWTTGPDRYSIRGTEPEIHHLANLGGMDEPELIVVLRHATHGDEGAASESTAALEPCDLERLEIGDTSRMSLL